MLAVCSAGWKNAHRQLAGPTLAKIYASKVAITSRLDLDLASTARARLGRGDDDEGADELLQH